jgi:hypothetical protein
MPLFNSQHQNDRGIRWRGIAATAMVELLVLFALAFAVVRYVEWSSAANLAEFMSATEHRLLQIIRAKFLLRLKALKVRCGSSFIDQVRRKAQDSSSDRM